jgi:exodeoxyribonuclease-3
MKIATWNVNSIRVRQGQVLDWLKENDIDVLCLQETKVIDKDFPKQPFEELRYYVYVHGQKSYNGVAIFSRKPLQDVITGFSPRVGLDLGEVFDEQKRVISGIFDDIRIVNLYVPNGSSVESDKYYYKLAWIRMLEEYLVQLEQDDPPNLCVCGDFNIALEDRDIYNPKGKENHIMCSEFEREHLEVVLQMGLEDAFRKFHPEDGHFTWWDYRAGGFEKNRGWRIDHIYLTSALYQKATNCYIDLNPRKLEQPSDHAPVILEIMNN